MSQFPTLLAALVLVLVSLALPVTGRGQDMLLADIFVPLPATTKVKNPPRHPPPPKKQVVMIVMEETVVPPPVDWAGIYASLARDSKGVVDWMRALTEQTITPKPGIDPAATEASTYDSEIEFIPESNPKKAATFRHATHTQWLSCRNCHGGVFKKKSDNLQFTHDDMDAGKYCGACHGRVVLVQSGCNGCHAKKKAPS